jgi:phosphopantetheinyl transferase
VPDFAAALVEAWSAKEAALKLLGVGLSVPPRNVKLQPVGSHRYGVCLTDSRAILPGEIHVSGFATPEYTACLATYELAPPLTFRRFPQDLSSTEFGAAPRRRPPIVGRN